MAGQMTWDNPGATTNAYVVRAQLEKKIYMDSEYPVVFSRINNNREVKTVPVPGYKDQTIDAGNDSPVWEKNATTNAETRFTLRERNEGMGSYGDADVKKGGFAQWKHSVCYTRQVDSPAYQIPGFESLENVKEVINDYISLEKEAITQWRGEEVEIDAWRSMFLGASRGLLLTTDGGRGISLPGGNAGEYRSPYHTYVAGQAGLSTPNFTRATHEATLSTLLQTLQNSSGFGFTYNSHLMHSDQITRLKFRPVTVGGRRLRAVAFIDPRLLRRLTVVGGTLSGLFKDAYARGKDNPAVNNLEALVLDGILYIPSMYMEYFRPTADGTTITYGCGMTQDPRSKSFSNSSNICMVVYCGAGALLRSRRKKVNFTEKVYDHGKGAEYSVHYHDGWMRNEWFTKDGRSEISSDSMLAGYYYDPGVGVAFAA